MGSRYHYDRHGNYKGKTTDDPPAGDGCLPLIVVAILFCLFSGGC